MASASSSPRVDARSDIRGFLQLAAHGAVVLVTGTALWQFRSSAWAFPLIVVHGFVLTFLFCAEHECIHRTAFRSRRANDLVAASIGMFLLLPSRWFRLFHAAHHRFTQDSVDDPELDGWKPPSRMGIVLHMSGLLYWKAMAQIIWNLARGNASARWMPPGHERKVVRQARVMLTIYATIAALSVLTQSWLVVQLWIVPALIGQPFLRAYLLLEHTGCPVDRGIVAGTRTTLTNPAMRFLAWNMPFHREHHAQPQTPFHRLPALHREWSMTDAVPGGLVDCGYVRTAFRLQRNRWREA